jgi:hypothetical protein
VGPARAAEPSSARGDESAQLFNEGRQLRNKGRFQEACAKFRAALAVRQSPGTLLNVANCQEADGDVAGALESVEAALSLAAREPDQLKSETWILTAREEIASLEPRVATLTVRSTAAAAPAVMLDGKPLLRWDTGLRLNPGHHEVEAASPRRKPFVRELELVAGQSETLLIPELEAASAEPAQAEQAPSLSVPSLPAAQWSSPSPPSGAPRLVSYSLLAAGSVAFAGGAVTGLVARKMASDLKSDCPGRVCDGDLSARDRVRTTALVADVLMGTGLVAGVLGVTLLLTGEDEAPASVAWGCGARGCAASWRGEF